MKRENVVTAESSGDGLAGAVQAGPDDLLSTSEAGPAAVRGGAFQTAAWLMGTGLGVASGALMYRHLGVIETGRYSIAITLVAIVAGVSDLGLTAVGVRELSIQSGAVRASIARNLLGIRLLLSVGGVVAATLFSLAAGYGVTLTFGVVLAGAGVILQSAQSMLTVGLTSELKLGWVATFALLRAALSAALIIALILLDAHLLAFLSVTIPVGIVVLAFNARVSYGTIPLLPAFQRAEWSRMMKDVLPYSVAVIAATMYFYLAILLVSLLASAKTVGYFGVSTRVIQILILMPGLAIGAAFPIFSRAARDDRARLAYALGRVFEVLLLVGVLVALCLAVGAAIAVKVVGGPKFAAAASLLAIQGVGLGASFVGAVWANGLLSLHRYRSILIINLLALVIGGGLIAALVAIDGGRGAAIATAADEFALAVLSAIVLVRVDRVFMPPLRIVPGVAVAALLAVATTLIDLPVLLSVTLAGAVYVAVVLALGLVPRELLEHVPWYSKPSA